MGIAVHLLLLLMTALAIMTAIVFDRGNPARGVWNIAFPVIPILLIGLASSLLMLSGGKPLLEWLLPLVGVMLIGYWCKTDRVFKVTKIAAPIVAVVLVLHFLDVAHEDDITNAPDVLSQLSEQRQSIALKKASDLLAANFDADTVFPPGPIRSILPDAERVESVVELKRIRPEWHSVVSRLYRVENLQGTVWYPGGAVGTTRNKLEVRIDTNDGS